MPAPALPKSPPAPVAVPLFKLKLSGTATPVVPDKLTVNTAKPPSVIVGLLTLKVGSGVSVTGPKVSVPELVNAPSETV